VDRLLMPVEAEVDRLLTPVDKLLMPVEAEVDRLLTPVDKLLMPVEAEVDSEVSCPKLTASFGCTPSATLLIMSKDPGDLGVTVWLLVSTTICASAPEENPKPATTKAAANATLDLLFLPREEVNSEVATHAPSASFQILR
jgi:hypothetical protein